MEWNRSELGKLMQTTRLTKGFTLDDVSEMTGVRSETVSRLEKGEQCRPPRKPTLAKLERALGVKLEVIIGESYEVMLYIASDKANLVEEARTKWPDLSRGAAIISVMQEWSDHREALRVWNREHPGANLEV